MSNTQINIRQILITEPIKTAIIKYNDSVDFTKFILSNDLNEFRLSRMEQMMLSNFDKLLQTEPVQLKIMNYIIDIDGIESQLYEIINGRHRVARAIIEDMKTIQCHIVSLHTFGLLIV